MRKWKCNQSLWIALATIIIFVTCSFVGVYLLQRQGVEFDGSLRVQIEAKDTQENIVCWKSDGGMYIFLPADAECVTLHTKKGYKAEVDGLSLGVRYPISEIQLNRQYSFSMQYKKELMQGNLIFMQSEEIPSLFITTDSGSMEYIHAVKGNAENGTYTLLNYADENSAGKLRIQGRGNTSWTGCEKKGYKLIFEDVRSLLGLKSSNTYLLIANARCNYLSNTMAFWLSEEIGVNYVPQCRHIDLYLNGEYVGNYILCEQITVGENSIDITDLEEKNIQINPNQKIEELVRWEAQDGKSKGVLWVNEPDDVSGGFFLERDVPEYYKEEVSGFVLNSGDHFVIKGPKYAGQQEVAYIQKYMQETYDALASADGYHPDTKVYYGEYLDIPSFALKYALEEFLNFNDAGRSSAYYYKDVGGKLCAGPGWDFEGAFKGNSQVITKLSATSYSTDWYEKLWQHNDFREEAIRVYKEELVPALEKLLNEEFSNRSELIIASAKMDEIRWGREDFLQNSAEIFQWIESRIAFLNEQWLSGNKYVSVTIQSEWMNDVYMYLAPGELIEECWMPQYVRDGFAFGGWMNKANGELFDFSQPIESDIQLEAIWIRQGGSIKGLLLSKINQVIPEVLFMALFGVVFIIFIAKFVVKEKKQ